MTMPLPQLGTVVLFGMNWFDKFYRSKSSSSRTGNVKQSLSLTRVHVSIAVSMSSVKFLRAVFVYSVRNMEELDSTSISV